MSGNASNKPGKRFESRFRASLKEFGTPMRLFDGSKAYNVSTLADYVFFRDGKPFFFECKAEKLDSRMSSRAFSIEHRLGTQMTRMREFRKEQPGIPTLVALQFYCEPLRLHEAVFVFDSEELRAKVAEGLKTINQRSAKTLGVQCPKAKGGLYDLTEVFERWG